MSEQSFADLGVSSAVVRALDERGYTTPFAIQKKAIGDVLAGRDLLAKSPTGSGKTLAFMVPLVDRIEAEDPRPAALVLAPTRELATQIVDETWAIAKARALKITAVYGGVGIPKQAREAGRSHIIVATPGRLEDLLARRAFNLSNVRILVLDEADRMLDMGFRPAVDRIVDLCPEDRQTLFFSATLDGEAGRVARQFTTDAVTHEHAPAPERKADIEHRFVRVDHAGRVDALVKEITAGDGAKLVFVRTKRGADKLVKKLSESGVHALAMHGDKSQRQREKALASLEDGRIDTLVATDVAARGIDVDGISHVINFDPPGQREDYVHRTGRTGRAGRSGIAVTLVAPDQAGEIGRIARDLNLSDQFAQTGLSIGNGGGQGGGRKPQGGGYKGKSQGGYKGRGNGGGKPSNGGKSSNGGGKPSNGGKSSNAHRGQSGSNGGNPRGSSGSSSSNPRGSSRRSRPKAPAATS
jgi:superfamily II DNA/RNA helicase